MNTIVLAAQAAQGGGMGMIIMMVAIFAIMYFFMIRPQQKQQKKIREFQNALKEMKTGAIFSTTLTLPFRCSSLSSIRVQERKRHRRLSKFRRRTTLLTLSAGSTRIC